MTVLDGALLGALCGWSHAVLGPADAAGGGAGAPAILELDDGSAPAAVAQCGCLLLLLHSPACPHCKLLMPELEAASAAMPPSSGAAFGRLDATEHRRFADEHGAVGFPRALLFVGGTLHSKLELEPGQRAAAALCGHVRGAIAGPVASAPAGCEAAIRRLWSDWLELYWPAVAARGSATAALEPLAATTPAAFRRRAQGRAVTLPGCPANPPAAVAAALQRAAGLRARPLPVGASQFRPGCALDGCARARAPAAPAVGHGAGE
jgi:hypothetical protein